MTFAYYAGPEAVKGLQKFHHKGEKVTKNALKKMDRILLPGFYKKVPEVMQEEKTTLKSLQNSFDDIFLDQWVSMHLDNPQNGQYDPHPVLALLAPLVLGFHHQKPAGFHQNL